MTNKVYIGIDPSINSTGIVIRKVTDNIVDVQFYIIKNNNHEKNKNGIEKSPLTKKEQTAEQKYNNFHYILYDKLYGTKESASYDREYRKTVSLINICDCIRDIILQYHDCECYACIEGISYGSASNTSAIYDLSGLNYMLRNTLLSVCKNVIIAPPTHVKKFATGNGSAKKETMIALFEGIYPDLDIPKKDDIADAWFMSLMAEKE